MNLQQNKVMKTEKMRFSGPFLFGTGIAIY